AVMQGKRTVYDTDLFVPLLWKIAELAGKKYGSDKNTDHAMRVVAEHSRGIVFLIADGVMPSNDDRGYVLRRLFRRTVLFGKRLGLEEPFLGEMVRVAIGQMGHVYPELLRRRDFILQVAGLEETKFDETLNAGLQRLEDIMAERETDRAGEISGIDAFQLYDTYGFPVELTKEIAADRGFSVNMAGFESEMAAQRERAKASHKFLTKEEEAAAVKEQLCELGATEFVGYANLQQKTSVQALLLENRLTTTIEEGQEASVVLVSTPFYAEMGGQVGDTGEVRSESARFTVTNTLRVEPDIIVHQGYVSEGILSVGDEVEAVVDRERRLDVARNHTATHLLQMALRRVLGEHVQQRGSLVAPERLRFDFSHLIPMTEEEVRQVEHVMNESIRQNYRVYAGEVPYKKAVEEGATALFGEKYGDIVRVVKICEPIISAELCGGTHVTTTGEIGFFRIVSESGVGAGLRRIEAVTGRRAETFVDERLGNLAKIAQMVGASPDNVTEKVSGLLAQLDEAQGRIRALESELARRAAESLLSQTEVIKGVTVLAARVNSFPPAVLRELGDTVRERLKSAVIVLGTIYEDRPSFIAMVTPDLVSRGYDAGKIVRQVAQVTGGGGGGKPALGQAGGKDKSKVDEALGLVRRLI
ncbi:MAG: alanine--tRNA ligase, partial [Chloroflexi bacterium]|nr:alanine--tRNA ligase [Chloroflexota bacterium]